MRVVMVLNNIVENTALWEPDGLGAQQWWDDLINQGYLLFNSENYSPQPDAFDTYDPINDTFIRPVFPKCAVIFIATNIVSAIYDYNPYYGLPTNDPNCFAVDIENQANKDLIWQNWIYDPINQTFTAP